MPHLRNRLSISGKVITAFAVVLMCTLGLGLFRPTAGAVAWPSTAGERRAFDAAESE